MSDAPEARIRTGSPTPEEEAAVIAALEKIWSEERSRAAAAAGRSPWIIAARVEGARLGGGVLRGPRAWRLSGLLGGEAPTPTQIGRGDAK